MRLAVCETPAVLSAGDPGWRKMANAIREAAPDLLLLSEMPFGRWVAARPEPAPEELAVARRAHRMGMDRLPELDVPTVLASRPALEDDGSVNQAFVWEAGQGPRAAHTKQYLPDEKGYFEARWFGRGGGGFRVARVGVARVGSREGSAPEGGASGGLGIGFLICTEVWFNEWARRYGRSGAHLIAVPRATPPESLERWQTAVRMAAMVSGCYVASSNRSGRDADTGQAFGGGGWIVDPDGELIAETSRERPVAAAEIDVERVEAARRAYPRYVEELPPGPP